MLEKTLAAWCQVHPAITAYFKSLNEAGIRWAIFAGTSVSLLTQNRTPTDVDIIVHDDDFEKIMAITPNATPSLPYVSDIGTGDGKVLRYQGDELAFTLDNTELEVMARATKTVEGHLYSVSFTDLAVDNRLVVELPASTIYIANPFDTIAIKAIMQRGPEQNKFDFEDTKAIVATCNFSAAYMQQRAKQINLDQRAIQFLRRAGLKEL